MNTNRNAIGFILRINHINIEKDKFTKENEKRDQVQEFDNDQMLSILQHIFSLSKYLIE
jgi:hypothetical protein